MKNFMAKFAAPLLTVLGLLAGAFGQITPSADSYTVTGDPTTNYGTKILLDVESPTQTTYIQFNLSSIPSTYTSADITKATLKLYVASVTTAGSFNVDYVNGAWTESTITANLAPALGTTIASSVPLTTAEKNQFILIDVTEAVQAWLSGTPNDGIALVGNSPVNATFDSKENTATSHAPELDIVFAGGGTISGVTTASGSGLTGGGNSGTLNLSLNACAANQVLRYNGTSWACAATGTGTITGVTTSPTSGLTGGGNSGTLNLQVNTALIPLLGANNTFTGNETLSGTITATSSGTTIVGNTNLATGSGVAGYNSATTGNPATGVWGQTASTAGGVGVAGATTGAVFYYAIDGAVGTEGATSSAAGFGVLGGNGATTGNAVGVYGFSNSTAGYGVEGTVTAPSGAGVYGVNESTTGNAFGVLGTTASSTGYGVEGSGPVMGVYGVSTSSGGAGVSGVEQSTSGVADGVAGAAYSPEGYGVYGSVLATTGTTAGVFGTTLSPTGSGVQGSNQATTGNAVGVYGASSSNVGYGVYGTSPGYGVYGNGPDGTGVYATGIDGVVGIGNDGGVIGVADGDSGTGELIGSGLAVWGDTGGTTGEYIAVAATADSNVALLAANSDSTGLYPTMEVENYTASTNTHFPVFQTSSPNTYSGSRHCTIDTSANLTCTGVVSGVIRANDGKETAVYAMQSAENWLEDAGSGQLSSGSARIELDPAFAQTVNAGVEYHVFLTPNGDSKGLYVSQKTATSFEVHEQGGGNSSIAFDYRIMAKRKGYENVRLEDLTDRLKQTESGHRNARPSVARLSALKVPTPPSLAMHSAPHITTPPMLPPAASRPARSKLATLPPARATAKPLADQAK